MPNVSGMPGMASAGSSVPGWDTAGAILLALWTAGMCIAAIGLALSNRGPGRLWVYRASVTFIVVGTIGQIGHLQEHIAQAGYWIGHPEEKTSWMTPWGMGLARGLGQVESSQATVGSEVLHLTGNVIFLTAVAGVMIITRRTPHARSRWWGKIGMWAQTLHVMEHLSLTLSVAAGAKAIGFSTWFGQLAPGPGLVTYRLWWHFVYVITGSYIFAAALYHLWRERHDVRATYDPASPRSQSDAKHHIALVTKAVTP